DLCLQVCEGTPRLYIFRARDRDLTFTEITYHEKVTQCLFGIGDHPWYLAVAKPTHSIENFPTQSDIEVFQIHEKLIVRLNAGVWHAGPLFCGVDHMDFLNLELSDTNTTDHNTHSYVPDRFMFSVRPP
ncbi:RmlC-like cupin domain-containing protein, partial [Ostreococcus tauri]